MATSVITPDPFLDQYMDQYVAAIADAGRLCPQNGGLMDADAYIAGCMEYAASGILTSAEIRAQACGDDRYLTPLLPPRVSYVRADRVRDYFDGDYVDSASRPLDELPQDGDYLVNAEYPLCNRCWDPSASAGPLSEAVSVVLVRSGRTIGEFAFCAQCVTQIRAAYPSLVIQSDWDRG